MKYNTERLHNFVISENGFIFDPTTGEMFSANDVGAEIINLLKEDKAEVDEIKKTILQKFDTDESVADKDIREFLPLLINLGLISIEL